MFEAKKIGNVKLSQKVFVKTAKSLIPKLRELNMPEMDEYADKLEKQLENPDIPTVAATLAEVTAVLSKKRNMEAN